MARPATFGCDQGAMCVIPGRTSRQIFDCRNMIDGGKMMSSRTDGSQMNIFIEQHEGFRRFLRSYTNFPSHRSAPCTPDFHRHQA